MNDAPDRPLDDILASIRKIVEDGQPVPDPEVAILAHAPPPAAAAPLTPAASTSIEQFVRSIVEPQINAWIDANLPELVERITREEIQRLTGH